MFPVLRQLSVTRCDATGRRTVTDDLIGRPFLDQLDVILVDLGDHSLRINGMVREPSLDPDLPVLWQSELAIGASLSAAELSQSSRVARLLIRVGSHAAENLRTQGTSGHDRFRLFQQLHNLVQYQSHLRLLLVPPVLWNHVEHKCAPIGRWKGNTVGACQRRGIEVRTYDETRPLDGLVVPEFLEYLRDKAARKGA
ncbi:hypothetical protein DMC30DRAFT_292436 [Rhodotorula diobovata]|uniref:Uncharacterized protein n=1 Tax=Rhodotorula diobovata TaxID=5288 RepID=A0A5C5FTU2_9BASI|nr:hypothetical protein DMC30DRAFT_292436 [Rhodotorula diobovata]